MDYKKLFKKHFGVIKTLSLMTDISRDSNINVFQEEYQKNIITYINTKRHSYHVYNNIYSSETLIERSTFNIETGKIADEYIVIKDELDNSYTMEKYSVIDYKVNSNVFSADETFLVGMIESKITLGKDNKILDYKISQKESLSYIKQMRKKVADIIYYSDGLYSEGLESIYNGNDKALQRIKGE